MLPNKTPLPLPRTLPPKPPLPAKSQPFLPKIQPRGSFSRNVSKDSIRKRDDSLSLVKSNDSNDVSYISTNSNSSSVQNKKICAKQQETKKFPFRSNSANSAKVLTIKSKPPKDISSKSWVIYNVNTMGIVFGKKHHYPREIASLTKIMTCYLTLTLAKRMNLPMNELNVRVTRLAASMSGTSAELKEGDQLKLIDLLYGLMLPSGNDASFALGEALGCLLYYEFNNRSRFYEIIQAKMICVASEPVIDPMKYFLNEMNKTAKELKLFNTTFANPHGLMNRHSKSTASDVAKLSCVALKLPGFLPIVNTKHYDCVIKNQKTGSTRKSDWFNTNKLLDKGFLGVKTGITPSAGPCLVTSLRSHLGDKTGRKEVWAVVVILNCRTMEKRWGECEELLGWGVKEIARAEEGMGSARDGKHN